MYCFVLSPLNVHVFRGYMKSFGFISLKKKDYVVMPNEENYAPKLKLLTVIFCHR